MLLDELDRDFRNADETWSTGRATTCYGKSKVCLFLDQIEQSTSLHILRAFRFDAQNVILQLTYDRL